MKGLTGFVFSPFLVPFIVYNTSDVCRQREFEAGDLSGQAESSFYVVIHLVAELTLFPHRCVGTETRTRWRRPPARTRQ